MWLSWDSKSWFEIVSTQLGRCLDPSEWVSGVWPQPNLVPSPNNNNNPVFQHFCCPAYFVNQASILGHSHRSDHKGNNIDSITCLALRRSMAPFPPSASSSDWQQSLSPRSFSAWLREMLHVQEVHSFLIAERSPFNLCFNNKENQPSSQAVCSTVR